MAIDKDIYKDNQYEPEFELTKKKLADGTTMPAAAQAGLFIWLSATRAGAEIHANVKKAAIERTGKPGTFYCIMPVVDINAHIFPTYDGKDVYVVLSDGSTAIRVVDRVKAFLVRPSA